MTHPTGEVFSEKAAVTVFDGDLVQEGARNMAQIDMPLVVLTDRDGDPSEPAPSSGADGLVRWRAVVSAAVEPCLLLDGDAVITGISPSAAALLGGGAVADFLGCALLSCGLRFVDFTGSAVRLSPAELERLPPLTSCRTGNLARALVRLRPVGSLSELRTLDVVSSPVGTASSTGSLSFLHPV